MANMTSKQLEQLINVQKNYTPKNNILDLVSLATSKAIQYAYRDNKSFTPSTEHYSRAVNVINAYYERKSDNGQYKIKFEN